MTLKLEQARKIIAVALQRGAEMGLKPLTVAVLDAGGALIAMERSDGASRMRPDVAKGKANGAIALGMGSRSIFERAKEQPYFVQAMNALADGVLVPVPGGVLIRGRRRRDASARSASRATHRTMTRPAPSPGSKP